MLPFLLSGLPKAAQKPSSQRERNFPSEGVLVANGWGPQAPGPARPGPHSGPGPIAGVPPCGPADSLCGHLCARPQTLARSPVSSMCSSAGASAPRGSPVGLACLSCSRGSACCLGSVTAQLAVLGCTVSFRPSQHSHVLTSLHGRAPREGGSQPQGGGTHGCSAPAVSGGAS